MTKKTIRRPVAAGAALAAAWVLSACATMPQQSAVDTAVVQAYVADHPSELRRVSAQVPIQGNRNRALNQMRTGLAALELGRLDIAGDAFEDALRIIESIYADNPEAEKARSVWHAESAKDFKGEPYERAMAYYYRGLVHLMQGDYQNARASFRGGLLQDSFMEENQRMTSDFGALAFLEGWAGRCAGFDAGTVNTSFDEARGRNSALAAPPPANNLLLLFETGTGPAKRTAGSRNEVLSYVPGAVPPLSQANFRVGERGTSAAQAEDLFFQAATRSGRWVDTINQGKVVYQDTTRTAGQAATAVGAGLIVASGFQSNNHAAGNMAAAGAAVMLVGLIAQAAAEAMKPEADARQWDNLPANILLASLPMQQAAPASRGRAAVVPPATAAVEFERAGQSFRRDIPIRVAGACAIAWGREVPALNIADAAPNTNRSPR